MGQAPSQTRANSLAPAPIAALVAAMILILVLA